MDEVLEVVTVRGYLVSVMHGSELQKLELCLSPANARLTIEHWPRGNELDVHPENHKQGRQNDET
jgi:hypothetical protein